MHTETEVERRDRALVAFAILTGMRDSALASLRLKHVDEHQSPVLVRQEPDQVRTKFSKNIVTYFFPVGDEIRDIALEWVKELRELKCYGPNDPLFPRTRLGHDANQEFVADGFESLCWSTASPVRAIFRAAFENAGLPYFSPHRLRDTLAHLGQSLCRTPEEFKAWSQNLGHESPLTTFTSYGYIDPHRQGQVMSELSRAGGGDDRIDLILKEIEGLKASRSLS
jgi:integrase